MQKQQFRTAPASMHRDNAIDKHKASVRQQVERDWGLRPQNPVLKPAEAASLNQLQTQIASAKLEQLHNAKHGNAAAQEQKSKAAGMVQSMNIHGGSK